MVELVVADIMSKAHDRRAHILLLQERDGFRKIIVALGMLEAQAVVFSMHGVQSPRPLTHDLFGSFAAAFNIEMLSVLIYKIEDGTFFSRINFKQGDESREVDARTSDAVALALRMGAPIYITEELLNRICIRDEQGGAISIPITAADEKTLRDAMDRAVKEEKYELAMKLKEELDSRQHTDNNNNNDTNENI